MFFDRSTQNTAFVPQQKFILPKPKSWLSSCLCIIVSMMYITANIILNLNISCRVLFWDSHCYQQLSVVPFIRLLIAVMRIEIVQLCAANATRFFLYY